MIEECMHRLQYLSQRSHEANSFYRIVHIHIPKTAGISFQNVFKSKIPDHKHLPWDAGNEAWREQADRKTRIPRFTTGHIRFGEVFFDTDMYKKPLLLITTVREPLERLVSAYNYHRSDRHPYAEQFYTNFPTFEKYVENHIKLPNLQSFWICGRRNDLACLRAVLNRYYCGVGTLEHLETYSRLLQRAFTAGSFTPMKLENSLQTVIYGDKVSRSDVPPDLVSRFYESNDIDLRLYQSANAYFENMAQNLLVDMSN